MVTLLDYYVKENGNYPNRSAYVRVSDVFLPTPQYFDNNGTAKVAFTGSLPKIGSGSFAKATGKNDYGSALFNENISATNIQGIGPNDYTQSIKLLGNKYVLPCLKINFCLISNFCLYNLTQLSKATFPKVTITLSFFKDKISLSKKFEQFKISSLSGLSSGGTHLSIFVI